MAKPSGVSAEPEMSPEPEAEMEPTGESEPEPEAEDILMTSLVTVGVTIAVVIIIVLIVSNWRFLLSLNHIRACFICNRKKLPNTVYILNTLISGAPQGSVLGPQLFKIVMSPIGY